MEGVARAASFSISGGSDGMKRIATTYQVYRRDREMVKGLKSGKYGAMIGAIRAEVSPCDKQEREKLAGEGLSATHTLLERLFTLARPGDVLIGGLAVYDVVAVEDLDWRIPYSAIYVKRRENAV